MGRRGPEQLTLSFDDYMLGEEAPRRALADGGGAQNDASATRDETPN